MSIRLKEKVARIIAESEERDIVNHDDMKLAGIIIKVVRKFRSTST